MSDSELDCLVIGAGPAGLAASLYLARFRRRFAVVDTGDPRASSIPSSHNIPFFPAGIPGPELLARQRETVGRYGVEILGGAVSGLQKRGKLFAAEFQPHEGPARAIRASRVLLATGAKDVEPQLPDLPDAVRRGLVRYCPICDGYEARGRRVAVLGRGNHGLAEAIFVARSYSCDVTLLTLGQPLKLSGDQRAKIGEHQIKIVEAPIAALAVEGDKIGALRAADGVEYRFDTLYSALGLHYRSELAACLGAERAPSGALIVDDHNQTTVEDLYAAGDVVSGLDQIAVALGHAAVAATRIHNRCELPTEDEGGSRRGMQPP